MSNFHVGQKVVRIGGNAITTVPAIYPEIGQVYTIRAIDNHGSGHVLIRLQEIDNSHMVPQYGSIEPGFQAQFFRPIVTSKTDISIFKAMLTPSKQPVAA